MAQRPLPASRAGRLNNDSGSLQPYEWGEILARSPNRALIVREMMMNTKTRMSLVTNRRALVGGAALAGALVVPAASRATRQATPAAGTSPDEILAIVRQAMDDLSLRSTILRIAIDGEELMTE